MEEDTSGVSHFFFWLVAAWVKSRAERPSVSVVNRQLHVQIGCKLGIRDTSGVSQAFSFRNGGGSEGNVEGFGSQDVEEVKGCGGRIVGEQRFDVGICT